MSQRACSAILVTLACTTCVTGVELDAVHPVPVLQNVQPHLLTVGESAPTLVLTGEGFVAASVGTWNGLPRATEFVSASELRVTLDPADVASPVTGTLGVSTPAPGGGVAGPRAFTIGHPVATIDSLTPASIEALTPSFTLRVVGTAFTAHGRGSEIVFGGATIPTVVVSSTELTADISDHLLPRGATVDVRVVNPAPGGGASDATPFTVLNPVPVLTSVSPDSVRLLEPAEVELTGEGFVPGVVVRFGTAVYVPTWVSPTSLRFRIPEVDTRDGTIRVQTRAPGGGQSNGVVIGIQEREPVVSGVLPPAVVRGRGDQVIRIDGFQFAPDAQVTWNGIDLLTTYAVATDPEQYEPPDTLIVTVPAALSASLDSATLRVTNPRGGGSAPDLSTAVVPEGRIALTNAFNTVVTDLAGAESEPVDLGTSNSGTEFRAVLFDSWPTGRRIVTTRGVAAFPHEPGLFITEPDAPIVEVTSDEVTSPRISPDAAWIYYTGDAFETADTVWRITPDGATREMVAVNYAWPEPSPLGDRLVLSTSPGSELVVLDIDDGTVTPLGVEGLGSRWSPDGEWIAYRSANTSRLRLVRPDGTDDRPLGGSDNQYRAGGFDWSPDGRFVLAATYASLTGSTAWGEMELIDVDTGDALRWRTPLGPVFGLHDIWALSWFADP